MPISAMGEEYSEEHWRRVRKVLERAIELAGMRSQLVWESAAIDVIQARILQNLYENDVVICDVSGLNPNVMLETGLRLSTRRPTIIVTDQQRKPPFDIQDIGYIDYPRDLEYNATQEAIERIAKRLKEVVDLGDKYTSFIDNFRFETVTPTTVQVPAEEYLKERIDELTAIARRIERSQDYASSNNRWLSHSPSSAAAAGVVTKPLSPNSIPSARVPIDVATEIAARVSRVSGMSCVVDSLMDDHHSFIISYTGSDPLERERSLKHAANLIKEAESRYLHSR